MLITGPFTPGVDYLGSVDMYMDPDHREYIIEIQESNLYLYGYLRFLFKQDLHRFHTNSIYAYVKYGDEYEMLPMKPTPIHVDEFIEYRVRLSETKIGSLTGISLVFMHYGDGAELSLKGLMFGGKYDDDVYLNTGFSLQANGQYGLTSPMMGYIPMRVGDVVDVVFYPYHTCVLDRIETYGAVCGEDGAALPALMNAMPSIKVRCMNPFDSGQITAVFRRLYI